MTFTVTITGGSPIEVYGGLDACDAYLLASPSTGAAAYRALSAGGDDRKRLLVGATRYIDARRWRGTRNGADGTALSFPRDGLVDEDGEEASNAYQLDRVARAVFELVALAAEDSSTLAEADQGSNIKSMGAGSARLEFFSPTRTKDGTAKTLPTAVDLLIGQWLAGSTAAGSASIGGVATGTCGDSHFDDCDSFKRREAF